MKISLLLLLFALPVYSIVAQDSRSGVNLVTHMTGFEIGYSYPYLTRGNGYSLNEADFSFGLRGGFEWIKMYDSGNILMMSPSVLISSFGNTKHRTERFEADNTTLVYRTDRTVQYNNMALRIPGIFEIPFAGQLRIGVGGYLVFPVAGSGSTMVEGFSQSPFPHTTKDMYNSGSRSEPSLGVLGRVFFPLNKKPNVLNFLTFEYMYSFNTNIHGVVEKWLTVSFIKRNKVIKEKRQKWDRYLMKR